MIMGVTDAISDGITVPDVMESLFQMEIIGLVMEYLFRMKMRGLTMESHIQMFHMKMRGLTMESHIQMFHMKMRGLTMESHIQMYYPVRCLMSVLFHNSPFQGQPHIIEST